MIETSYSEFKNLCLQKGLIPQAISVGGNTHAVAFDGPFSISCVIANNSQDSVDFNDVFGNVLNKRIDAPRDYTGRPIQRQAVTADGWHYQAFCFEYETSTATLFCKDSSGINLSSLFLVTRLNQSNQTTQDESEVVCDLVTFSPSFDYEIISGEVFSERLPTSDVRVWTVGGCVSLGAVGVKCFVNGLNLKFERHVKTDGRASKYMKRIVHGVPFPCNEIQFKFCHEAGVIHKMMIVLEIFRQ